MHLITLKDWTSTEINQVIDDSLEIKQNPQDYEFALEGRSLALIFQKTSTRTRLSFEVAMTQLGGHAAYMDWRNTNLVLADLGDETKSISGYVDGIMARVLKNSTLQSIADAATVPVINGCDEKYHPCQIIADLVTIKEKKGKLKGLKLAYIGVHNNICNSLIEGCTRTGMKIVTVTPLVNKASVDENILEAAKSTGLYSNSMDVNAAVEDCDVIYTDTWVDMEFFLDPKFEKEKQKRVNLMLPYQVNKKLLATNSDALIMHDMPIHRGYEISDDVIMHPNSVIFPQSENRLYSAKAILNKLLR
ncbi:MAG: ornithine carbamoyltransferase [Candidatus Bathyarchaeota archaeon]|nr:ornithine carbamoyltransferase [Candidatus Bathyarchaeum tardum]WGM89358.1 MAG: ornithine carbamoyltransferase [Candidatus Bathyarchaeum tardum]WNZ28368.1 MAG: ornithine carbamoyltransferase [Candidatus Bathyarchaeota archaeon]